MPKRTFIVKGSGVSPTPPTSLQVTLDGIEIFNGTVPTVAEQQFFTRDQLQQCFSWEMELSENSWEKPMTITVSNGDFVLGEMLANYVPSYLETQTLTEKQTNFLNAASSFRPFFITPINPDSDDRTSPLPEPIPATDDPKFDVKIDGISRTKSGIDPEGNPRIGQWTWQVGEDSTISFTVKCNIKSVPDEVSQAQPFL